MVRLFKGVAVIVLLVTLAGCASTTIRDSWTAPGIQGPLDFQKILVVFIDPTEATRRAAEDALVTRIGSDRAVASHTLLTMQEVQNAEDNQASVRSKLQGAGVDSAVVMRLVNEQQKLSYSPGMTYPAYYGGFYGYYGRGWGMAYSPGYLRTDTIVSVETNLYSLDDDKLIYAGTTETFNPNDIAKMVNEIADAVNKDLRSKGLVTGN